MKIGILTYHCVPNFGAQLQAISTVGFFRKIGYDPIVLHWYPSDLESMYAKRIPKQQIEEHKKLAQNILPLSSLCRTEKELIEEINRLQLDAIFVGSDALFKYVPLHNRKTFSKRKLRFFHHNIISVEDLEGNPFFGGFLSKLAKQIPAFAFSVSSQNCPYFIMSPKEKVLMNQCISNYNNITVRDEWTKQMVEEITKKQNILITPDPVFSFNQNYYLELPKKEYILKKFALDKDYILLSFSKYYMNKIYIQELANEITKHNIQPAILPMPEGYTDFGIKKTINLPLSPIDWYALIKYSKGYIGERMHPIVVSIHNSTPFFCFDEYGTFNKKLWGLKKEYIKKSSKTYLIVERANLLNYLFSYKENKTFPTPKLVIDKILNFPKLSCTNFANKYQQYYEDNMLRIVSRINDLCDK